jgi:uncharacterized membrane protein
MVRALGWLGIAALAACAHWFDSDSCRVACAFALLALIGIMAPHALRLPLALIALIALTLILFGGVNRGLDAVPALICGLIAWIFARTLRRDRVPLIARAITALDGAAQLSNDPAVARYARRLTWVWAIYQATLAAVAALLAIHAAGGLSWLAMPSMSPRLFGAIVLPLAVAILFLSEFALRRWLLPQAPRHSLLVFVRDLIRAWPSLIGD